MIRIIVLGILLFVVPVSTCLGQAADSISPANTRSYYLVLYKPGRISRYTFYTGQHITFKLFHSKTYYSGKITAITKTSFVFWDTEILLSQVEKIQMENHTPLRQAVGAGSTLLRKAGGLFALVGALNGLVLPDHRQDGLKFTGLGVSVYGLGRGGKMLQKRSYKINRFRLLQTRETY